MDAPPLLYYDDGQAQLWRGRCELLPWEDGQLADAIITDLPFSAKTHTGARTNPATAAGRWASGGNEGQPLISFPAIGFDQVLEYLRLWGPRCRRWFVAFMDYRHVALLETALDGNDQGTGLRFIRYGVWVAPDKAPQFSGDRPGMGWEAYAVLHRTGQTLRWNGGGHHAALVARKAPRPSHPNQKPSEVLEKLVRWFSDPGDLVVDPFAGSGAVLVACKRLGRRCIGVELDAQGSDWCAGAERDLRAAVTLQSALRGRGVKIRAMQGDLFEEEPT